MSASYTYTFKVPPRLFRRALYFNTFFKQRFQAVMVGVMWLFGVGLMVANLLFGVEMTSVMQLCYIVICAALPLMVFSCEQSYRHYRSAPLADKDRQVSLSDEWLKFRVSGGADSEKIEWRMLSAAFELEEFFILYRDTNLMVLLPKADIPADEVLELRALFRRNLGRAFRVRISALAVA